MNLSCVTKSAIYFVECDAGMVQIFGVPPDKVVTIIFIFTHPQIWKKWLIFDDFCQLSHISKQCYNHIGSDVQNAYRMSVFITPQVN